ncbi:hypothetical protein NZD89_19905 [Alicyclobacillus fastidiosus]|uniref:Uncharacterized protein n=1 Tax=Alicyclobacillus fastidiosus TaxID=392011 RepID=A0ABY6ZCE6_9BACL|nr:hypothetical protein [Alicyclobacillus fastidiosus]WAH40560.1 hypothetical protein NZD89_19905 [Alicyclobacillus fastidiosus]GMA61994.1 hypothetical protein GCM10025859_24340 [Alicyclobacillus fastidiosus]
MNLHIVIVNVKDRRDLKTFVQSMQKKYVNNFKIQESAWILGTDHDNKSIRKNLKDNLSAQDELFVCSLPKGSSWKNVVGLKEFLNYVRSA